MVACARRRTQGDAALTGSECWRFDALAGTAPTSLERSHNREIGQSAAMS